VGTIQPDVVRGLNARPRLMARYQCILLKDEASSGDRRMGIVGVGFLYYSRPSFSALEFITITGGLLLLDALVQ